MSCQPGKHAKQPLEKQNSPLSRACGMSMIYLGRNLPSVLISLKETVTKIATGHLKINQLSCAVAFPLFPLMLNPNSHPSIHVSMSLAPLPSRQGRDGGPCRVIANSQRSWSTTIAGSWSRRAVPSLPGQRASQQWESYLGGREEAN